MNCPREVSASVGIDLRLDTYDGAAASVEAPDRDDDLVTHLRCAAIERRNKSHTVGKLKYGLRAVETVRRIILEATCR